MHFIFLIVLCVYSVFTNKCACHLQLVYDFLPIHQGCRLIRMCEQATRSCKGQECTQTSRYLLKTTPFPMCAELTSVNFWRHRADSCVLCFLSLNICNRHSPNLSAALHSVHLFTESLFSSSNFYQREFH